MRYEIIMTEASTFENPRWMIVKNVDNVNREYLSGYHFNPTRSFWSENIEDAKLFADLKDVQGNYNFVVKENAKQVLTFNVPIVLNVALLDDRVPTIEQIQAYLNNALNVYLDHNRSTPCGSVIYLEESSLQRVG